MMFTNNRAIKKWSKLAFCGLLLLTISINSYGYGTLFTSPQQRASFDLQRSLGYTQPKVKKTSVISKQNKIFFNGYVVRKSGPSTSWANDRMLLNDDKKNNIGQQQGVSANLGRIKGTTVPVKVSTASRPIRLQPGQNLNLETGEISENYKDKKTFQQSASKKLSPSNSSQDMKQTNFSHKTEEPEVLSPEGE
jgi:hypothetical protein